MRRLRSVYSFGAGCLDKAGKHGQVREITDIAALAMDLNLPDYNEDKAPTPPAPPPPPAPATRAAPRAHAAQHARRVARGEGHRPVTRRGRALPRPPLRPAEEGADWNRLHQKRFYKRGAGRRWRASSRASWTSGSARRGTCSSAAPSASPSRPGPARARRTGRARGLEQLRRLQCEPRMPLRL